MPSKIPDEFAIEHDEQGQRFCARLEGYEACLMYRRHGNDLDL